MILRDIWIWLRYLAGPWRIRLSIDMSGFEPQTVAGLWSKKAAVNMVIVSYTDTVKASIVPFWGLGKEEEVFYESTNG